MDKKVFLPLIGAAFVLSVVFIFWGDYRRSIKNDADKEAVQTNYGLDPQFISSESSSEVIRKGNNAARKQDVKLMSEAARLYLSEHPEGFGEFVTSKPTHIAKTGADICPFIVPNYMGCLPRDPRMQEEAGKSFSGAGSVCECNKNYTTGFFISINSDGKIIMDAPLAENGEIIKEIR